MKGESIDVSKYFSREALETISASCKYAYDSGHRFCNSSHLFLTCIKTREIYSLLSQQNLDLSKVEAELLDSFKNVSCPVNIPKGKVLFSPDLRIAILQSYLVSVSLVSEKVEIKDLFLSCLYSPLIHRLLTKYGINVSFIENLIIGTKTTPAEAKQDSSLLTRFTNDITRLAKNNTLEEIVNRQNELAQLTRILVRKSKNNVVLLGESGVGRSSIVHLLAQKIVSGNVPQQLQDMRVLELNMQAFISAAAIRNINELTDLLKEELRKETNVVLFIKNIEIASEGSIEKTLITHMIKYLTAEIQNRLICTMSSPGYKQFVTKEKDLAERFEVVKVAEPSLDLASKILESKSHKLSQYHNVAINPDVLLTTIKLSKRYIQDKFLPSKAIDLLDETCSQVVLDNRKHVTSDDVKTIIAEKTGIPIQSLTVSEQRKLVDLEGILNKTVIGQKQAVHIVSEVIRRSRAGLKDPKRPIGSFLFLGPSGVGKTYLAKNLARVVYDNEKATIRLDMSEFSESHTVQRLIGSPPGYVGYEEGGQLTNPVWEQPYSLILLDEIEKAHPNVFDIFLQVLDEGRLTDGQGRTVDFKNTIIIATSNIAAEEILEKISQGKADLTGFDREKFFEQEIMPILKLYFRPEFINRFDEIVIFNSLEVSQLQEIANLQIEKIRQRLKDKAISLNVSEQKLKELASKSYNPSFGARPLIRLIQEQIENVLARKIISGEIKQGDTVNL